MLEVKQLTKRFGGLIAVSAVDLSVIEGEIVSLIGPNGAGKTTLFASIAGFLKPDGGDVQLNGQSILNLKPHKICQRGMVRTFQITQPFAALNTLENIMVGAYSRTGDKALAQREAERVADIVGMTSQLHQKADGLTVAARKSILNLKPHKICQRGMVRTFQITQPFAALNTLENIMVGAYSRTGDKALAQREAERVADIVGMTSQLHQKADGLTVAARKRLELARALATKPKLLLLDEVMAGLNPTEIDEIVDVIKGIRDTGVTIFLIEHVMKAVVNLSDRTYVLNDGKLIAQGTPESVASNPIVIEAYLGHGAAAAMAGEGAA